MRWGLLLAQSAHSTMIKDGAKLRALATLSVPPPAQGSSSDGGSDRGEQGEAQGEEAELRG